MKVSLSVGKYAAHPFVLEGLGLRVYCAEELCYCLKENAFLIDTAIMSDALTDWIRQECGLDDLAEELHSMIHKKGSLSSFVIGILEYVDFYDQETLRETERTLKKGAGLNALEKRKLRADQLLELHKYTMAVSEYEAMLSVWEEDPGQGAVLGANLRARLLHNKGVARIGQMRYDQAAEAFYEAYQTDGNEESLFCFLAAKRMQMTSGEYVAFVAGNPEYTEITLQLEKKVELINRSWETEADYKRLAERGSFLEEDERGYQEETAHMLNSMKENYRSLSAL